MTMIFKIFCQCVAQLIIYIKRPLSLFDSWATKGRLNWMPDKWYLSFMFRSRMGYWMDWKKPKTFNEKLQWLKVHDRNPLYTKLVDKYEVRKYIAEKIGEEYLIPLLGVWDNVDDIDFEKLPNQFVLKCTHDSGSVIICKTKKIFNQTKSTLFLKERLKSNFYYWAREWPYKNVSPRIIAEKFLDDESGHEAICDYKFFCFNGIPEIMYVSRDKDEEPFTDFYDINFKKLNIKMRDKNSNKNIPKPLFFDTMINIAKVLSKGIPHLRVDFFIVKDKLYIGELTFFHCSGFAQISPQEWAFSLGEKINLTRQSFFK